MKRRIGRKFKVIWFVVFVVSLIALVAGIAVAAAGSYAFGYKDISNVRGHRVYVWTGQRPDNQIYTSSPVGICQNTACSTKIVETGWVDGTGCFENGCLGDVLQQYVTYRDINNTLHTLIGFGNLANDTWYQFKVLYSTSASRWEAWRGSDVVWFQPNLGWVSGNDTAYGSEAAFSQNWMDVYGYYPEYKVGAGAWTFFIHDQVQTLGGGCIVFAYTNQGTNQGYRAYGPRPTCP